MADDISPVLIAQSGPLRGERWVLSKSSLIIGRDSDCDIVIADNTVSRRHAVIVKRDSDWVIEDTSKNGTYVNEKSVEGTKRLNDGDFVSIATAVAFLSIIRAPKTASSKSITCGGTFFFCKANILVFVIF